MDVIPYTKARATLAKTMEQVCDDPHPDHHYPQKQTCGSYGFIGGLSSNG